MPIDPKEAPVVVSGRTAALPQTSKEGVYTPLSVDQAGRLRALLKGAVEDGILPADALAAVESLPVQAFCALFNGLTWDRARSTPDNADGVADGDTGLAGIVGRLLGWNGATFDRLRTDVDTGAIAPGEIGLLGVVGRGFVLNAAGNWVPAEPPAPGVNSILTGLTTAASTTQDLVLDLGVQYNRYRLATMAFTGVGSTTSAIEGFGSNDNVSFFYLVRGDGVSSAYIASAGSSIGMSAFVGGYRYLKFRFINGTTAQVNASMRLGAQ